jgi:hypothetical protein
LGQNPDRLQQELKFLAVRQYYRKRHNLLNERRFDMPGFNGTGPMGMGPRTGGGRGFCAPGAGAGFGYGAGMSRGAGQGGIPWGNGRGRAWGGGRGRGWYGTYVPYQGAAPFFAPQDPRFEAEFLRNQSAAMEQELQRMRARIDELENKAE